VPSAAICAAALARSVGLRARRATASPGVFGVARGVELSNHRLFIG
jgi:hypothetical protein